MMPRESSPVSSQKRPRERRSVGEPETEEVARPVMVAAVPLIYRRFQHRFHELLDGLFVIYRGQRPSSGDRH